MMRGEINDPCGEPNHRKLQLRLGSVSDALPSHIPPLRMYMNLVDKISL